MSPRLITTPTRTTADVRAFFDAFATRNVEQHGPADRLLAYRVRLLAEAADLRPTDTVLDVGCGNGHHIFALSGRIARGIGVDLSGAMVDAARARLETAPPFVPLSFEVDDGRLLRTRADASVDVVVCVGAIEHMIDHGAVLASCARVLRPGGRLAVLTVNGAYVWHRWIGPRLGLATRHLATDRFLTPEEARRLALRAGFEAVRVEPWTFVPKGDVPRPLRPVLDALDLLGRLLDRPALRGGLLLSARRPAGS